MVVIPKVRLLLSAVMCLALAGSAAAQTDTRVNVGLGNAEPDGVNSGGVISGDGRFVVFASLATNLVAGDANASADVFVRDVAGATTSRVSLAEDSLERAGASGIVAFTPGGFDISDDGRYVVFASRAALVAGDTATCAAPNEPSPSNCPDIYLRDRQLNQTVRISVGTGGAQPNGFSSQPRISGDGRWVAFTSAASNLVANDTNGVGDVFLFDRQTSAMTRVSQATGGAQADLPSSTPALSDDGGVIAFVSASALLSSEPDTVACERAPPACERPFVVDRVAGTTRRVPMPAFTTSFTIDNPPSPPLTLTYRVTASSLIVSPDGSSVVVNVTVDPSIRTITTGATTDSWIYDRAGDRITVRLTGTGINGWDGRRYTTTHIVNGSVIFGDIRVVDTVSHLGDAIEGGSSNLPFAGGLGANGRFFAYTVENIGTGVRNIFVRDLDPDADGMPSYWESHWGLDPALATDAAADPDGDGATSLAEYGTGGHPRGTVVRYLAEGAANAFFSTLIDVANPGTSPVPILLRYQGDDGRTTTVPMQVHARGKVAIPVFMPGASSFSTVVEASGPVAVDRTMTWGGGYGSHAETAATAPALTWFLAEGATHGAFNLFYLLQNPGATAASVDITYLRPSPTGPLTRQYTIPAGSRLTIAVDAIAELAATDVSAQIVSDAPILVERSMYMNTANPPTVFGAGHAGAGVTATATRWFLAEGATGSFFDLYYLIANPATQATTVRVSYLLPTGAPLVKEYAVAAQSRLTISVDGEDARLTDTPVSAIVESTTAVGIVVERSMWWPGQGQWQEGHLSAATTASAQRWLLAAGAVGAGFETYVLIANTSATAGTVTLTTLPALPFTQPFSTTIPIQANSRVSVPMSQFTALSANGGSAFGTLVESDGPDIVVERAMYTDFNGIVWAAGTAALGTPLP